MIDSVRRDTVVRYPAGVRTNHWLVAIAFVLAALSGLALFHPALFWFTVFFGGGPWTRILHPFIGLFMVLVFLGLASSVWDDNRLQPSDRQWLRQWRDVVNNREERLPEVGRYNAGQKLVFLVIVLCLLGQLADLAIRLAHRAALHRHPGLGAPGSDCFPGAPAADPRGEGCRGTGSAWSSPRMRRRSAISFSAGPSTPWRMSRQGSGSLRRSA